jgi:hypothetical protein
MLRPFGLETLSQAFEGVSKADSEVLMATLLRVRSNLSRKVQPDAAANG